MNPPPMYPPEVTDMHSRMFYLLREKLPSLRTKIPAALRHAVIDMGIQWNVYVELVRQRRAEGKPFSEEDRQMLAYYEALRSAFDSEINKAAKLGDRTKEMKDLVGERKPGVFTASLITALAGTGIGVVMGLKRGS